MTLAKLKASPFGVNDELTSVEINILNDEIQNALDAVNGGTYVAVNPVTVGGIWGFTGDVLITGTFKSNTIVEIGAGATLRVDGTANADFKSGADCLLENGSTLTGNTGSAIFWSGASTWSIGLATFNCNVLFQAPGTPHLTNGALFDTGGTVTLATGVTLTLASGATVNVNAPLIIGTGGYIRHKKKTGQDTAAVTYDIAVDGDVILWSSLTADRTCTIADATDGATMHLALEPTGTFGGFKVTVKRADTTTIDFLKPAGSGAGTLSAFWIIYTSGAWKQYGPTLNIT